MGMPEYHSKLASLLQHPRLRQAVALMGELLSLMSQGVAASYIENIRVHDETERADCLDVCSVVVDLMNTFDDHIKASVGETPGVVTITISDTRLVEASHGS